MEEESGFQRSKKQPPPIKQPAMSLGTYGNRSRNVDNGESNGNNNEPFSNSLNSDNGEQQFFSKTIPRRSRPKALMASNAGFNGFKDANPNQEAGFPGNSTYSYIQTAENGGSSSPLNGLSSSRGFPSREDLSRQSTHSLMAEERLRSGDERMIEKYEELKRRQKAFLRALSANFATDVAAADHHHLTSAVSTGSLSAMDHK